MEAIRLLSGKVHDHQSVACQRTRIGQRRGEVLDLTLLRYEVLYNHQLPQSALKSKTPLQAMKDWHHSHPLLSVKKPYDRPGCDT